jgi:hypothetical protein
MPAMPVSPGAGGVDVGADGASVPIAGAAVDDALPGEGGVVRPGATVAVDARPVAMAVVASWEAEPHAETSVAVTTAAVTTSERLVLRVTPPA